MQPLKKQLKPFLKPFQISIKGLWWAIKEEQSFRLQLVVAFCVIFAMFWFPLTSVERAICCLMMALVLGLELLNSQLEGMLDMFQPCRDPRIKKIKDLSSAAVGAACLGSIAVGLLIFLPYLLK
ncbi:MAG: diacylglycerol kinase family protein [Candidatus Gribaldobacteria bacterium]|nr:diacylglycerol kinase family protein [Candidatus Gribaldobacteria bacterium]